MGFVSDIQAASTSTIIWILLALLRLLWTLIGQNGYIHPDEYFQSIQIVTEDLFNQQNPNRTWEFTSDNPIRNIAIPYIIYGFPIKLLSILVNANIVSLSTDNLILYPRLSITLVSYLNDYYLYKCAKILKVDKISVLVLFGSSYITLVYLTHTFSNSIETCLFTMLIYSVLLEQTSRTRSLIGLIMVVGVFNRPTFILYSIVPVGYCIHAKLTSYKPRWMLKAIVTAIIDLAVYAVPVALLFTCIDTFYYNKLSAFDFDGLSTTNLVLTPLNFVLYNIDSSNVQSHGAHSFYRHATINCMLLFGFNYILFLFQYKNRVSQFLYHAFVVPLICFTFISHQEPRFLLPLVVPICLLTSEKTFKHTHMAFTWFAFNFVLAIVYGVYHQGALIKSIDYVNGIFHHAANSNINTHVIYYNTYMVPAYLVNVVQQHTTIQHNSVKNIYDLMSSLSVGQLETKIQEIVDANKKSDLALFLFAPAVVDFDLCNRMERKFRYEIIYNFLFHAQFESFDKQVDMMTGKRESCNFNCTNMNPIERFLFSFTLNFYQIIV
jgi:phosphatidylinositol glycan class Z